MIMTNKLLPVALVAALIGGSVGALVMNRTQSATAETTRTMQDTAQTASPVAADQTELAFNTASEQTAYKTGFADGFAAASEQQVKEVSSARQAAPSRVVYRSANSGSRTSSARRVYYDYQPRKIGRASCRVRAEERV